MWGAWGCDKGALTPFLCFSNPSGLLPAPGAVRCPRRRGQVQRQQPPPASKARSLTRILPPSRPRPRRSFPCLGACAHIGGGAPAPRGRARSCRRHRFPSPLALLPFPPLRPLPRRQPARQPARPHCLPAGPWRSGWVSPPPPDSPGRSPQAVAGARWMWLAAAAPSLARRRLFLGPPPPPLLLLLLSRSSRRRRRLHSLGLAAMPEKRPFERLPADVSPINYSLCLKPDLLDFTFEGKLEASAQVRRPSGAGGELPGKQLGRARGLGWGPDLAGGPGRCGPGAGEAGSGTGAPLWGGRWVPGLCALPCWAGARAARLWGQHTCVGPPPDPGPSGLGRGLGEAGGCWGGPRGHRSPCSAFSVVLPTLHGGHFGRDSHLGLRLPRVKRGGDSRRGKRVRRGMLIPCSLAEFSPPAPAQGQGF